MFASNTSQVSNDVKYIEDFFSAWLRTGTGSSQTVTTGIKENTGALVISKSRSAATDWAWYDTFRGATKDLVSNSTAAQTTQSQGLTSFNADGHTWGTLAKVNTNGATYVDYVLKPTPKFFDVVTYTGTGSAQNIAHNLGSVPGCIIVKRTDSTSDWFVFHRKNGVANQAVSGFQLNATNAAVENAAPQQSATTFNTGWILNSSFASPNVSGATYVAYLFAHNAGGFGLTGTDNVISCGSFTTDGSGNATVNLGYEPQFYLVKRATVAAENWYMVDCMRGNPVRAASAVLRPNTSGAETTDGIGSPTAAGFEFAGGSAGLSASATYIYIAIRRGPMKTPTSGTSVFTSNAVSNAVSAGTAITTNFPVDMQISQSRTPGGYNFVVDRLRGVSTTSTEFGNSLRTDLIDAESATPNVSRGWNNTGWLQPSYHVGDSRIAWNFRRAPGFFDEVCYTGTGATYQTVSHNLGAIPELVIVKSRDDAENWTVMCANYNSYLGKGLYLNRAVVYPDDTAFFQSSASAPNNAPPTATTLYLYGGSNTGSANVHYVAYLFASCPGVSKVGSYTGNGSTQTINCGFTGGARFVLIKRTDSTGDWYVWDTARGIVSGNDPYLLLNSTAAEVTSTDYIDTYSAGFEISSTAPAAINANGGTFIYLAIA